MPSASQKFGSTLFFMGVLLLLALPLVAADGGTDSPQDRTPSPNALGQLNLYSLNKFPITVDTVKDCGKGADAETKVYCALKDSVPQLLDASQLAITVKVHVGSDLLQHISQAPASLHPANGKDTAETYGFGAQGDGFNTIFIDQGTLYVDVGEPSSDVAIALVKYVMDEGAGITVNSDCIMYVSSNAKAIAFKGCKIVNTPARPPVPRLEFQKIECQKPAKTGLIGVTSPVNGQCPTTVPATGAQRTAPASFIDFSKLSNAISFAPALAACDPNNFVSPIAEPKPRAKDADGSNYWWGGKETRAVSATNPDGHHEGVDIAGQVGVTSVMAVSSGVIESYNSPYPCGSTADRTVPGTAYLIKHDCTVNGKVLYTKYCHLNTPDASAVLAPGTRVQKGQAIGKVGKMGNAGGAGISPHLHIEYLAGGNQPGNDFDPVNLGFLPPNLGAPGTQAAAPKVQTGSAPTSQTPIAAPPISDVCVYYYLDSKDGAKDAFFDVGLAAYAGTGGACLVGRAALSRTDIQYPAGYDGYVNVNQLPGADSYEGCYVAKIPLDKHGNQQPTGVNVKFYLSRSEKAFSNSDYAQQGIQRTLIDQQTFGTLSCGVNYNNIYVPNVDAGKKFLEYAMELKGLPYPADLRHIPILPKETDCATIPTYAYAKMLQAGYTLPQEFYDLFKKDKVTTPAGKMVKNPVSGFLIPISASITMDVTTKQKINIPAGISTDAPHNSDTWGGLLEVVGWEVPLNQVQPGDIVVFTYPHGGQCSGAFSEENPYGSGGSKCWRNEGHIEVVYSGTGNQITTFGSDGPAKIKGPSQHDQIYKAFRMHWIAPGSKAQPNSGGKTVYIGLNHDYCNAGAVAGPLLEANELFRVSLKIREKLEAQGYQVIFSKEWKKTQRGFEKYSAGEKLSENALLPKGKITCTSSDAICRVMDLTGNDPCKDPGAETREFRTNAELAKQKGAVLAVAPHFDATPGKRVVFYDADSQPSINLAKKIAEKIQSTAEPDTNSGKGSRVGHLEFLKFMVEQNIPAVTIEVDRLAASGVGTAAYADSMANSIVQAVASFTGASGSTPRASSNPQTTPSGSLTADQVPVLTLHQVYGSSVNALDTELNYLQANGYTTVTLNELEAARATGKTLPQKTLAITVDDGYLDGYTVILKLLKKYSMKATFFIITGRIYDDSSQDGQKALRLAASVKNQIAPGYVFPGGDTDSYGDRPKMSWGMVQEMQSSALAEFDSHTHDVHGTTLGETQAAESDPSALLADLQQSQRTLTSHGITSAILAWPNGYVPPNGDSIAQKAGFAKTYGYGGAITQLSAGQKQSRIRAQMPESVGGLKYMLGG